MGNDSRNTVMSSTGRISSLFVLLWSSAYIAFEFCSSHVEPATFVVVRCSITATILFYFVLFLRLGWPRRWIDYLYSMLVGVLIHGFYGGGVFASIYHGLDVRLCALILSLQPGFTVLLSSVFLAEKITKRTLLGMLAGFFGVAIVILEGNVGAAGAVVQHGSSLNVGSSVIAIALCFVALLAISGGTIVQKRYCSGTKLMSGACLQFTAAAIFMIPIAMMFETTEVNWNPDFVFGLGWLIIFVSIGAMSLLMMLINNGSAGTVANLFYLVTPLVAILAWILFEATISTTSFGGMLLCVVGVAFVNFEPSANYASVAARASRKMIFGVVVRNVRVQVDYVR